MNGHQVAILIVALIFVALGFWALPAVFAKVAGGTLLVFIGLGLLGKLGEGLN